ncbi:hypothetical protein IW261DRAFT_1420285 [Armillaria novae-zelandiae]|uniref:Uncharacterized protein n=1 Tax=Armillaria novae-zelandiae TaxID=153914 RepID=A0AA39P7W7_9AGAR|nr:hypothetical protein IW261DRAFT_1420285 [Armillaria novae-zelandiae]
MTGYLLLQSCPTHIRGGEYTFSLYVTTSVVGLLGRRLLNVGRMDRSQQEVKRIGVGINAARMPPRRNAEDLALQDSSRQVSTPPTKCSLRTVNKTFIVQCLQCNVGHWDVEWRAQVVWLQIIAPGCEVIVEWTRQVRLPRLPITGVVGKYSLDASVVVVARLWIGRPYELKEYVE